MQVQDILKTGSLFTEIKKIKDFAFIGDNPKFLDSNLFLGYGERQAFSKMVNMPMNQIAEILVSKYEDYWDRLIEVDNLDIDIGASGGGIQTEKETYTENRTQQKTDHKSEVAFNTVDESKKDSILTDGKDTNEYEKIKEVNSVKNSLQVAYNNLSMIEKNNIIKIVLNNVAETIGLSIYK